MAWFRKTKKAQADPQDRPRSTVPEGLWVKCEGCKEIVYSRDLDRNLQGLPQVRLPLPDRRPHPHLPARSTSPSRGSCSPASAPVDPLNFRDTKRYRDRLKTYQQAVGERDAVIVVQGAIEEIAGRDGRDGVPLHGRLHGLGGGREDHPRRRAGRSSASGR